ncbi:MAG: M42 family metallopeptidase [Clostridiales bacterium]|nr:M42 family metallopeptidase [Clostridiales bacterium]
MLELLKDLCVLDGVSGFEDEVREDILKRITPLASEIKTDSIGNVIAYKKGKKQINQTIMLASHMDEVGFIIKKITDEGMLKFGFCGGIDRRVVIGKRVRIGEKKLKGVIGIKAIHLIDQDERKSVPKTEDLYIDIGAQSKKEAEELVSLGDYAAFDSEFSRFGDGFIRTKAIDDRIGCAVLIKLMELELPVDMVFTFTVQEETGLRGATVAAHRVKPDYCLILEGTTAADLPFVDDMKKVCKLNGGPVIPFMDSGTIYNQELCRYLIRLAEKNNVPWQTKKYISGGTDAGKIHVSGPGVKTCALAVPVRYLHSANSVASISDCEKMLLLAKHFIENAEDIIHA